MDALDRAAISESQKVGVVLEEAAEVIKGLQEQYERNGPPVIRLMDMAIKVERAAHNLRTQASLHNPATTSDCVANLIKGDNDNDNELRAAALRLRKLSQEILKTPGLPFDPEEHKEWEMMFMRLAVEEPDRLDDMITKQEQGNARIQAAWDAESPVEAPESWTERSERIRVALKERKDARAATRTAREESSDEDEEMEEDALDVAGGLSAAARKITDQGDDTW